jgi:hypothetical protein
MTACQWLVSLTCLVPATTELEATPWLTDYQQALHVARTSGKPLFVVFRCEH